MNKQQLSEALERMAADIDKKHLPEWDLPPIFAAARLVERLLPGVCADCEGSGQVLKRGAPFSGSIAPGPCGRCDGSGQVWDEGIVEAVAAVLASKYDFEIREAVDTDSEARAVLSALVELLTEKAGVADRPVLDSIEGVDPSEYSIELSTQPSRLPE